MNPCPSAMEQLRRDLLLEPLGSIQHVILDRDGVLNEEIEEGEYLSDPQQFRWLPGVLNALTTLRALCVRVSVVTNQSGIGRGLMSESQVQAVHRRMSTDALQARGSIDAVFYCPHAPDTNCSCRKPAPGLIVSAIDQSGISPSRTLVVGDDSRDLEAARHAGDRAALVRTGKGRQNESFATACGIPVFNDLFALAGELSVQTHPSDRQVSFLQSVFAEHAIVVAEATHQMLPALSRCIEVTRLSLRDGHTVFACGNGGSASDAQHFVAELVGRYKETRAALPAMALTADSSTFTAVSNDFGYDAVFSRVIEAFAKRGDVLIAISTSGNSRNVLAAAAAARQRGCTVIGLTGQSGGQLAQHADIVLPVPSDSIARIQEVHGLCLHALAQALDSDPRPAGVP